ncbi:hypothetical protein ACI76O_11580 [Capnocytophaga cynodegmi]|uniref:hypothetical protein n=1 Tax=Capnocytophaga cynodegmi TaxID=28189 RepID=UPI00385E66BC
MNYEQALKKMWAFNEKTPMGANAIALYSFLLKYYSDKKQVIVSDYELAKILVMARQTVITTKNKLRDWGFIDFSAERGKSSVYEFLWDTKHKNTTNSIETFTEHSEHTEETKIPSPETKLSADNTEISSHILLGKPSCVLHGHNKYIAQSWR